MSERGVEGAPTLAIEILSASTAQTDHVGKRQLYARHGVPFYWLVDPEARVSPPPFEGLALEPAGFWP